MALELQNQERERISLNINSIEYKNMFIYKIIYSILIREREKNILDRKRIMQNLNIKFIYFFNFKSSSNFKYILNLFACYSFFNLRPKLEYQIEGK